MSGQEAVRAEGLKKSYGDVQALRGIDLTVPQGTVLGLLGPNGAGKTTAVRILTTLLPPDGGSASVAGLDVVKDAAALRSQIGLAGQYAAVDENLTGRENLEMVGRLYHLGGAESRTRADELLERFDLTDAGKRLVRTYSGGMRRRLDLAAALVARPPVIFLDEPTTGLDPLSRLGPVGDDRGPRRGRHHGAADHPVPRRGRPAGRQHRRDRPRAGDRRGHLGPAQGPGRRRAPGGDPGGPGPGRGRAPPPWRSMSDERPETEDGTLRVAFRQRQGAIAEAVRRLDEAGVGVEDVAVRRPTLDDVFISLTGHAAEEEEEEAE